MFNLGAGEVLVILLLALIVLGPQRLPDAAKQVGRFMGEMRKLSSGFQNELKHALDDETEAAARARGAAVSRPASTGPEPKSPATVTPPAVVAAASQAPAAAEVSGNGSTPTSARKKAAAAKKAPAKKAAATKKAAAKKKAPAPKQAATKKKAAARPAR